MSAQKTTKNMTANEKRELQKKLDSFLEQAIKDVSAFAELYEIRPQIRITNNKRRLGSAKADNGAHLDSDARRFYKREVWNKAPIFKISISTQECENDSDLRDTLYHEVIHCAHGCFNHGKGFKALAAQINAAYGTNVTTRKKSFAAAASTSCANDSGGSSAKPIDVRSAITSHIGESFKRGSKTYTFTGFNGNPKNCCDLTDAAGLAYKCPPELVAEELGLIGAEDRLERKKQEAAERLAGARLRSALNEKIGESFHRGRKTYTFTGFNSNPINCCDLSDATGGAYKCSMESCASFLGI